MEFTAERDFGEHLVQFIYCTDKEMEAQNNEMTFLQVTQTFSQKAMNSPSEKSSFISLLRELRTRDTKRFVQSYTARKWQSSKKNSGPVLLLHHPHQFVTHPKAYTYCLLKNTYKNVHSTLNHDN